MPVSSVLSPAYILHRYPYRETSLLLDCFVRSMGRMQLIARGARRNKKSGSLPFQCFTPFMIGWYGNHELKTLTQIETLGLSVILEGERLACGFYLNELLMRLCKPYDAHERLFEAYDTALARLGRDDEKPGAILREFELLLLAEMGFAIDFNLVNFQVGDDRVEPACLYHYLSGQGFVTVNTSQENSKCFSGATLKAISRKSWSQPGILAAAKRLTRLALAPLLGDKPLKSRVLLGR